MAYVSNSKITVSLHKAFAYASGDKEKDGKEVKTIATAMNCTIATAPLVSRGLEINSKLIRGQKAIQTKGGREVIGWHFQQNFAESPAELDPQKAHDIGLALAKEMFPNYAVVIGTHANTDHVHNHIVIGAWGLDGKKHSQSNAHYQKMREVSDRLCDEAGLSVLDETRKVNLVRWQDEEGEYHLYEPTERKRQIRAKKEFAKSNDYRDTTAYERKESNKESNALRIKNDIDLLLGKAISYEHLLEMLRKKGYTIRDKKANGDWMAHISYKAPGMKKATRDLSLDESGYYTRGQLEQTIKILASERLLSELMTVAEVEIENDESNAQSKEESAKEKPKTVIEKYHLAKANFNNHQKNDLQPLAKTIIDDGDKKVADFEKAVRAKQEQSHRPGSRNERLLADIKADIATLNTISAYDIRSKSKLEEEIEALVSVPEKLSPRQQKKLEDLTAMKRNLERIKKEREQHYQYRGKTETSSNQKGRL